MKPFFLLGEGDEKTTNIELGIDATVVSHLKKNGEAERHWLARDIFFKYSLKPLKFADMMRKKVD